jgi:hypothetical protein
MQYEGITVKQISLERIHLYASRRAWQVAFVIPITIAIFGYLGIRAWQGIRLLTSISFSVSPAYIGLAISCQVIGVLCAVWMWGTILKKFGIQSSYQFNLRAFGVSAVARKLPGTIWYAVSRLLLYQREGHSRRPVVLALAAEVVTLSMAGLLALALGLFSGLRGSQGIPLWLQHPIPIGAGLVILLGLLVVALPHVLKRFMERSPAEQTVLPGNPVGFVAIFLWLFGELLVVCLATGVLYFSMKAIVPNTTIPFATLAGAFGASVALGPLLVWMPADMGLRDGVMYLVLAPVLTGAMAAVVVLAWRLMVTALDLLFGLVCVASFGRAGFNRLHVTQENDLEGADRTPND